jgi:uncharacterized cupredoxin-like copper-binding protein
MTLHDSLLALAALCLMALSGSAAAGAGDAHGHGHAASTGQPDHAREARRTVEIVAVDSAFQPESVAVSAGETVRFVIRNEGELLHEFSIGTPHMHEEHRTEMQRLADEGLLDATSVAPGVEHAHGNSVFIGPKQSAELTWTFGADAEIEFACNLPGHYEAGMKGAIDVGS